MKIQIIFTVIIISISMMANAQNTTGQIPVMIENESRYDFAATVDTISDIIVSGGWKVIT